MWTRAKKLVIDTVAFCAVATGPAQAAVQHSVDPGASVAWGLGIPLMAASFVGWIWGEAFPRSRSPGEKSMLVKAFLFGLAAVSVGVAVHF